MTKDDIIKDQQKQIEVLREENQKLIYKLIKMDYDLQIANLRASGMREENIETIENKWIEDHKDLLRRLD